MWTTPKQKPAGKWTAIVREYRNYVPIIKGTDHLGSGLLVSSDGFILTNEHVVRGHRALLVSLHDGTTAKATPVHNHDNMDLAIVKSSIHTERYFELSADSLADGCDAGDEALAIGHPRGLSFTATTGIVSESARRLRDGVFVQTDVAINPGNSGGPLFDVAGKLIGLNTQVMAESHGLGFAIPARQVFEYWKRFLRLYRSGSISIPTDEQLSQVDETLTPRQIIESASEIAEIAIILRENDENGCHWSARTESGKKFHIFINDHVFVLTRRIAELEYLPDARLLFQLLRWQSDMYGIARFEIDDDHELMLRGAREFENLDVSEVAQSLLRMEEAVDRYADTLGELLEEDG